MKKIVATITAAAALASLVMVSGCGGQRLESPKGLSLNADSLVLSWAAVDFARGYEVRITKANSNEVVAEDDGIRRTTYSLEGLAEGDYDVYLRATADGTSYGESEWVSYPFEREAENGCLYRLINNDTEYEVYSYGISSGDVVLGGIYRGKPVTQVAEKAFRGSNSAKNIEITDTVTKICDNAFFSCTGLESVTIGGVGTELGVSVFQNCTKLTDISLPAELKSIPDYAFNNCRSLEEIDLGESITHIGEAAFVNTAIKSIVVPDSVQTLGDGSFRDMDELTEVTLGAGLEDMGKQAFMEDEALETVNFAEGGKLTTLGEQAFINCTALKEIELPAEMTQIGSNAFYGCSELRDVTLPEGLTGIGQYAFVFSGYYNDASENGETYVFVDDWLVETVSAKMSDIVDVGGTNGDSTLEDRKIIGMADAVFANCENLNRFVVPSTLKYLGGNAFTYSGISAFTLSSSLGNSLETIGNRAFFKCENLTRVNLMDCENLRSIGDYAFYECEKLENNAQNAEDLVPASVEHLGMMAFYGTQLYGTADASGVIYAGDWAVGYEGFDYGVAYMYYSAEGDFLNAMAALSELMMVAKSNVQLKEGVRGIADYAFYGNVMLAEITNFDNVLNIGEAAFYGCEALKSVTFNNRVESLPDFAFYGCKELSLTSLNNISVIGRSAFYGCTGITSLDFGGNFNDGVTSVGPFAFYNCINLAELEMGDVLTDIGRYAFYNCDALKSLSVPDSVVSIGDSAFRSCSGLTELSLGAGVERIEDFTFFDCFELRSIQLGEGITAVGDYAFYGCRSVTSVSLPESLVSIGDYAFARLINITSLVLPANLAEIGDFAFRGCTYLGSVILPDSVQVIGKHAFFMCSSAIIYAQAEGPAAGWDSNWNSSRLPVAWGTVLSADGKYVVSVQSGGDNFDAFAMGATGDPVREGYEFAGWSTAEGASEGEISAEEIAQLPSNTTIYAIWKQNALN